MYVTAIVLAAGKGLRLRSRIPKPLLEVNSKPVIIHSLKTLSSHPLVRDIVVVVNAKNSKDIIHKITQYRINKVKSVVRGGRLRQDSVRCGLKAIGARADMVLIHDAARPFINAGLVSSLINQAKRTGAATAGVPVKATIKKVAKSQSRKVTSQWVVERTIERRDLWEIQTPQVFKKNLILKAYERFGDSKVTDDAMLVEKLGDKVAVVLGSYSNIKITTPEDLIAAKAIARHLKD